MVPKIYLSMPEGMSEYFTDEYPLGPVAAEHIRDDHVAAYLLNPETDAFRGVMHGASIILGRRGAGKSALLNSLTDRETMRRHLEEFYRASPAFQHLRADSELSKSYFFCLNIDAPNEMAEVDRITRQIKFPTVESSADAWRKRIMHNVLLHFLNTPSDRQALPKDLRTILEKINSIRHGDARMRLRELIPAIRDAHLNREDILTRIENAMEEKSLRALVLIDTMEEYRIRDGAVCDVVAGLLYEISRQSGNGGALEIKAALPTEIYRIVHDAGAPGKYAIPTEFIHWSSHTLIAIAAHRAMIMARLRHIGAFDRMASLMPNNALRLEGSAALMALHELFPQKVNNEVGTEEDSVLLVLRHTLMLPRQVLNVLSLALKTAHRTQAIPCVTPAQMEETVNVGCDRVMSEVFSAYRHVYPDIGRTAPPFLRYCQSISHYGELHKAYNETVKGRFHHEYVDDFPSFLSALVDCGLIGVKYRETPRYIEAKFAYNYIGELNFTSKDKLVIHPAACRQFDISLEAQDGKAVLPFGSYIEELQ
jgi:hypothetical protein